MSYQEELQKWRDKCQAEVERKQAEYNAQVEAARARVKEDWSARWPKMRAELLARAEAQIDAEYKNGPNGPEPLSEAEKQPLWDEAVKKIDEQLNQKKEQEILDAGAFIPAPMTLDVIMGMWSHLRPQEELPKFEVPTSVAAYDAIWTDGEQYWDVANACLVNPHGRTPIDQSRVVMLGNNGVSSFEQNIRENIKLYGQMDPRIKLGPEVMDTEELFARLREQRSERLAEYDQKIAQLDRLVRQNPEYTAYSIQRAEWDAYATALCNLPSLDGAPWDGGGPETPWPALPQAAAAVKEVA